MTNVERLTRKIKKLRDTMKRWKKELHVVEKQMEKDDKSEDFCQDLLCHADTLVGFAKKPQAYHDVVDALDMLIFEVNNDIEKEQDDIDWYVREIPKTQDMVDQLVVKLREARKRARKRARKAVA